MSWFSSFILYISEKKSYILNKDRLQYIFKEYWHENIIMTASARQFRTSFKVDKALVNWFPGHMNFSFKHMQAKMRLVDCIIEVHDSRIPFSGRNPKFLHCLIGPKPHILVLNKKDLIDELSYKDIICKCQEDNVQNVIFTNSLNQKCKGLKRVIPTAVNLIQNCSAFNLQDKLNHKIMVVGVPNVGKSSFINALRNLNLSKGRATAVGAMPGVTKKVQNEVKVSTNPSMFLIDTPGILSPSIENVESGMKLALCSCIKDSIIGIQAIADFLLYWMNKTNNFHYVKTFNLKQPIDNIAPLLLKIAVDKKFVKRVRSVETNSIIEIPNIDLAAEHMVKLFRQGDLGDLYLDQSM